MKTVIVSGGSSGIGLATIQRFIEKGYLAFNLDIQPIEFKHDNLIHFNCDVSSSKAIDITVNEIKKHVKAIDALVCSAGIHYSATLLESSEADFDRLMDINVRGCFFLTKAILPMMIEHEKGSIVYVGSDQTIVAKKNSSLYGMTKAALGGLTKSTALDYAKFGIRSNLVAAGTVDTPLVTKALQQYCDKNAVNLKDIIQSEQEEFPLKRIAQPDEIANLIYFLSSDQALFITGAIIPIDGGYTAQ
jgi:2-keto-3-deoxy-L-fuconate dehydrogenase